MTIIGSRGDVYLLGEAYAFGVVWSFFLKALGVLVLRFQRHDQEYKTPLNIRIGRTEIPIGLGFTVDSALFLVAIANLFTKQIATIYGVIVHRRAVHLVHDLRTHQARRTRSNGARGSKSSTWTISRRSAPPTCHARPGCVLVACATTRMAHLDAACCRRPTCGGTTSW